MNTLDILTTLQTDSDAHWILYDHYLTNNWADTDCPGFPLYLIIICNTGHCSGSANYQNSRSGGVCYSISYDSPWSRIEYARGSGSMAGTQFRSSVHGLNKYPYDEQY